MGVYSFVWKKLREQKKEKKRIFVCIPGRRRYQIMISISRSHFFSADYEVSTVSFSLSSTNLPPRVARPFLKENVKKRRKKMEGTTPTKGGCVCVGLVEEDNNTSGCLL